MKKYNFKKFCYVLTPFFILIMLLSSSSIISAAHQEVFAPENKKEDQRDIYPINFQNMESISVAQILKHRKLYVGGQPVGVKLNTKGVLVVALSDIEDGDKKIASPAAMSGILIGDSIIKINNLDIKSSEDASKEINKSEGKEMVILIERNGEMLNKKVIAYKCSKEDVFKIGIWIRDSTAGVGTLTFYNKETNKFAALGHPITDMDTGQVLKVNSGNLTFSSIVSVKKGEKGIPGELRGIFMDEDKPIGKIIANTQFGIFGIGSSELINNSYKEPLEVGLKEEVKEGNAKIITTVEGDTPQAYDVVIEKLFQQQLPCSKSMIVKVTDPRLLDKTGGIVQGMSGSPIIQDNKIVGAITHVLVNKPDTGYGVYIEWMLKDAEISIQ